MARLRAKQETKPVPLNRSGKARGNPASGNSTGPVVDARSRGALALEPGGGAASESSYGTEVKAPIYGTALSSSRATGQRAGQSPSSASYLWRMAEPELTLRVVMWQVITATSVIDAHRDIKPWNVPGNVHVAQDLLRAVKHFDFGLAMPKTSSVSASALPERLCLHRHCGSELVVLVSWTSRDTLLLA